MMNTWKIHRGAIFREIVLESDLRGLNTSVTWNTGTLRPAYDATRNEGTIENACQLDLRFLDSALKLCQGLSMADPKFLA